MPSGNATAPKRAEKPPPPFVYRAKLPTGPVATFAGDPDPKDATKTVGAWTITEADLLDHLLRSTFSTVGTTLTLAKVIESELAAAKLAVTDAEVADEVAALLNKMSPGKKLEDVVKSGAMNRGEIERQAWLTAAVDKLYKAELKATGTAAPAADAGPGGGIMKQLYMRRLLEKYEIKKRGEEPGPKPGLVAEVKRRDGGDVLEVRAEEGLDFMLGLVRPASLVEALAEMVDGRLATEAAAAANKTVSEEEVWAWAATMTVKYPPPFDWATICRIKGTTTEGEAERWRRIQCWKRATGKEATAEELAAFLKDNMDYFSGQLKNVSHILIKTRDDVTGVEKSEAETTAAKKTAESILEKASEGVDFGYLARTYSEDHTTAQNGGELPQPVKKYGGGLDPEFQKTAYGLELNGLALVRSSFGWHVIRCTKVTPGREGIDFKSDMYQEHIRDEYETQQMKAWLEGLRNRSKVEKAPLEKLWKLKELKFSTAAATAAPK
jgi:peptidyl-prolyl cis-trans isomerase SurA